MGEQPRPIGPYNPYIDPRDDEIARLKAEVFGLLQWKQGENPYAKVTSLFGKPVGEYLALDDENKRLKAEVERLKGYQARRDARIAELDAMLTEARLDWNKAEAERDEAYTCARMAEERVARLVGGEA